MEPEQQALEEQRLQEEQRLEEQRLEEQRLEEQRLEEQRLQEQAQLEGSFTQKDGAECAYSDAKFALNCVATLALAGMAIEATGSLAAFEVNQVALDQQAQLNAQMQAQMQAMQKIQMPFAPPNPTSIS